MRNFAWTGSRFLEIRRKLGNFEHDSHLYRSPGDHLFFLNIIFCEQNKTREPQRRTSQLPALREWRTCGPTNNAGFLALPESDLDMASEFIEFAAPMRGGWLCFLKSPCQVVLVHDELVGNFV